MDLTSELSYIGNTLNLFFTKVRPGPASTCHTKSYITAWVISRNVWGMNKGCWCLHGNCHANTRMFTHTMAANLEIRDFYFTHTQSYTYMCTVFYMYIPVHVYVCTYIIFLIIYPNIGIILLSQNCHRKLIWQY